LGALIMRGTFIGLGTYALHKWHWVIYVFGGLLVITGVRLAIKHEEEADLGRNPLLRVARRILPVTHHYHGQHFIAQQAGKWVATPLLLVLLLVEGSDLVFAVDSIPAIFAITDDAFVVYTSNVFAILGLRSMYFMLGDIVHRFRYLKYGLAVVLVFVGSKMLLSDVLHIPTAISLAVVALAIGGAIVMSVLLRRRDARRTDQRIDRGRQRAGEAVAEHVPAADDANNAGLRNDDQELAAEPVAGPDVNTAAVVAPPLIAITR
jgi:tellurite resistance protein TerC